MANSNSAWGIEIGAYAIKAIRLERNGDDVSVSDFAVIPHKKVLSTPDLDQNETIRLSLGQFISQKPLENETLVMSVPGHAAFARFAKLPPVEPKKVPDMVKYEAVQQIPFPIDEVEWDYEVFYDDDSPNVEVGIFAITRERVQQRLSLYSELGITPESLTLSPVSVYNAMAYDHELTQRKKAVIYLDIGTTATDLIVANENKCWIRTFPLGGTHFTEAIVESFKLSYSKAEKLKQEASTSKYAKQIMQAMRPVFSDLLQDIQRSLGYYQSVHRDVELPTMVGIGSTFKIPGLRKFLGQQLQMEVLRLDEYRKVRVEGREAASFAENAVNMATAYGLALQGVGLAPIEVNLVPVPILREQLWQTKTKWFAAAAAIAVVGGALQFYLPMSQRAALPPVEPAEASRVISQGQSLSSNWQTVTQQYGQVGYRAENLRRLLDFRDVWPYIVNDVNSALASTDPQEALLGDDISAIQAIPPAQRRLVELQRLNGVYVPPAGEDGKRTINVAMRVTLTHDGPDEFLNRTVRSWLREHAERDGVPYRIVPDSIRLNIDDLRVLTTSAEGEREAGSDRRDRRTTPPPGSGGAGDTGGGQIGVGGGGGGASPIMPGGDDGQQIGGGGGGASPIMPPTGGDGGGASPIMPGGGDTGGGMRDPSRPGGQQFRGTGDSEQRLRDARSLDELAPVPPVERRLPGNTRYFEMRITFTVEILDPQWKTVPDEVESTVERTRQGNQEASS